MWVTQISCCDYIYAYLVRLICSYDAQNQSISRVEIDAPGQGYVDGHFNITSNEGANFESYFTVNEAGAIVDISIKAHGRAFTADPSEYDIYYPGTNVKQTNSITGLSVAAVGSGYVDGDIRLLASPDAGFLASVAANATSGAIVSVEILSHGVNITEPAPVVTICFPGSSTPQESSVTEVKLADERMTSGCSVGEALTALGGGGAGFYATITGVDAFGSIMSLEITNHGFGYTEKPSIVTDDSNCLCSSQTGSVPGSFDQCFELKVAIGATIAATQASGARLAPYRAYGAILTSHIPVAASLRTRIAGGAQLVGHLDRPTIRNTPSTGSVVLRMQGAGLGHASYTAHMRVSPTQQERSGGWISDSTVMCQAPTGRHGTIKQIFTVGEQAGSISQSITFDVGQLSQVTSGNRASTGATSVTVTGAGLGLAAYTTMMRVHDTAGEATEWESETAVRCIVGHGTRGTRRVAVTAGDRAGSVSQTFSVDVPVLSVMFPTNNPTTGVLMCTLRGSFLGLMGDSQKGRIGGSACEQTIWEAQTALRCKVPAGIRGTRKIVATAGRRAGTRTEIFSYDGPPGVSAMGLLNRAVTGAQVVTVTGLRFGMKDYTDKLRFGVTACEYTEWFSDTAVSALSAAGIRGTRRVVVTVRNQKAKQNRNGKI